MNWCKKIKKKKKLKKFDTFHITYINIAEWIGTTTLKVNRFQTPTVQSSWQNVDFFFSFQSWSQTCWPCVGSKEKCSAWPNVDMIPPDPRVKESKESQSSERQKTECPEKTEVSVRRRRNALCEIVSKLLRRQRAHYRLESRIPAQLRQRSSDVGCESKVAVGLYWERFMTEQTISWSTETPPKDVTLFDQPLEFLPWAEVTWSASPSKEQLLGYRAANTKKNNNNDNFSAIAAP